MNRNKQSLIALRKKAKEAPIGSEINCPSCGATHKKTAYNTVFCKTKGGTICKDNYWNNVTPSKRNNTTRISPANDAYMKENGIGEYHEDFDDDQGWDAHKNQY